MIQPQQPIGGRSRVQPPATSYPSLENLKLPHALVQSINQSFQTTYAVRDQTTANADAINHMILYGTMADRLNSAPTALPDGALWFVTDYPNAVYEVRVDPKMNQLAWFYATGVIWKKPTTPPAGFQLGLNDAGYMAVNGVLLQVWTGTAWQTLLQGV